HCLFTMGLGSGDYNNLAFDDADLVISCGYDLVEYAPSAWNRTNKDTKKIIHIDFMPAEVDRDYMPTLEVISDLADALWQINELLEERFGGKLPLFDLGARAVLRKTMADDFVAEKDDESFPMKLQRVLHEVREFMGGVMISCCRMLAPTKCGLHATINVRCPILA
ncbi:MAG: hypothetical protein ACKVG0_14310, partial [Alphaproteobacteria bacterium]